MSVNLLLPDLQRSLTCVGSWVGRRRNDRHLEVSNRATDVAAVGVLFYHVFVDLARCLCKLISLPAVGAVVNVTFELGATARKALLDGNKIAITLIVAAATLMPLSAASLVVVVVASTASTAVGLTTGAWVK